MLALFRSTIGKALAFTILGIGLIAIVITGFGTDGMGGLGGVTGPSSSVLARVGNRDLTDAEFQQLMDNRYRFAQRQQPTLDRAQFLEEQFDPTLQQVIGSYALSSFGHAMGLRVPQSVVDRELVQIPAFLNAAGQFDQTMFQQFLAQQGMSEQQARAEIADGEVIQMLLAPIGSQVRMPRAVAYEYASLLAEQRRGTLGGVPTEAVAATINPNDQQIAAYYQQNQRSFMLPERRVLRYALIGREQLGDAVRATDAEIQAYYQENQATYGPTETRNLQRIILPDEAAARAFVQRVQGGTSFADAAQQAGFAAADITFPNQNRDQFASASSPEIAAAAFGAPQGGLVGPLRSNLGFQVVRVEGITRTPGRPLEAVRGEIASTIEQRKLTEQVAAISDRVQGLISDGNSLEEIAQAERLRIETTPPVTVTGQAPGTTYQFPAPLMPLLQTGFQLEDSDPLLETVTPDQQMAVIVLGNVTPPTAQPLETVRAQVRARLVREMALQRAREIADQIVERINGGMAPAQAYAQAGIPLPAPRPIDLRRSQIVSASQQVPPPLRMLFSIPERRARVMVAPNAAGWIIVHHDSRTPGRVSPDSAGVQNVARVQQEFGQSASAEAQEQFARAILLGTDVRRNEDAIQATRNQLIGAR